ncbi:holo-ACP synthase [Paenibacillus sp. N1-5-1-14]|uniref:holo-ACP synthase n=1 Tax=Paenibacillus radicibacter TaxID=2972488 RepID=UPI0021593EBD|nr:holo-ACP synthase [Paenibacillus radicibacter]MCR8643101.1 holo-ACP synthase [Paenibacillus radicibacter]
MIKGIGNDIIQIERIGRMLESASAKRFIERVLTPAERKLAEERKARLAEFVAGRFAVKEAVVKALGCGIGAIVGFQDMEITPDELGKPHCMLSDACVARLGLTEGFRVHVSISHSEGLAAAFAVVEN